MNPLAALSGQYRLRPGLTPAIVGTRPVLAPGRLAGLLRGQQGEQLGRSLASLFTLCAHAHVRTAALALGAARSGNAPAPDLAPRLCLETARDHLRSIALDWPQRLGGGGADLTWLAGCPLPLGGARAPQDDAGARAALAELRLWLEQNLLRQRTDDWLQRHREPNALQAWCEAEKQRLAPARSLAQAYPLAHALKPAARPLALLGGDAQQQGAELRLLSQSLALDGEFAQRPTWRGGCAENGPWARLRHATAPHQASAWARLSARLIELVELTAGPDPVAPLLASGALPLGTGQAVAWCEMARGLLLHWVQLDRAGAVEDYRVLAPTEWNFHPEGALAQALGALAPQDGAAARMLAAAFDPCVDCELAPG